MWRFMLIDSIDVTKMFTGEESLGRFLDLHAIYENYVNLKGISKINYVTFLDACDDFSVIPKEAKNADYTK